MQQGSKLQVPRRSQADLRRLESGQLCDLPTRKPMLLFTFDGALFKFSAKTPALTPLFQLPPRIADTALTLSYPARLSRVCFIQPPSSRPTSSARSAIKPYCLTANMLRSFARRINKRNSSNL